MPRTDRRAVAYLLIVATVSLVGATILVGWLEVVVGIPNASAVYLVAVVATAYLTGTVGAIVAAVGSFLLYNYLFTEPFFTFTIEDPGTWLSVILLLFVGIVVGQLAAVQRSRTEVARAREREARALFHVSRALATRPSTMAVLPEVVEVLRSETQMERVWIAVGGDDPSERVVADSADEPTPPTPGAMYILRRMPGDIPAQWVRVHLPGPHSRSKEAGDTYRVRSEAQAARYGSLWTRRARGTPAPDRIETRLLAAAADQIGQVLAHDKLAADSQAAEIARQSDELKSALLQSVSHDLRTPLATIRAAAGSLRPDFRLTPAEKNENVDAIDREVEYLNRMVTNLLDLSRIEAGALRAERDVFELDDLIGRSLERLEPRLGERPLDVELDVPPVEVDPIFLDSAFTNIVENAIKYTPAGARLRIRASEQDGGRIRLTIEDSGPGVPDEALPRLFDKFYRAPGTKRESRSGTGIGLAVVRGLVDAMGGHAQARRSELGGLAIDLDLPAATMPAELPAELPA